MCTHQVFVVAVFGFGTLVSPIVAQPCAEEWIEGLFAEKSLENRINDMISFDDGSGEAMYIAGRFYGMGDKQSQNVIRFDGERWHALGAGLNDEVSDLAVLDLGGGAALYAAGGFTATGDTPLPYIARWDGQTWQPFPASPPGGDGVLALATLDEGDGSQLYALVLDDHANNDDAWRLRRWTGGGWETIAEGAAGPVYTLRTWDDGHGAALYLGGSFDEVGGVDADGIAYWRDGEWRALGKGLYEASGHESAARMAVFDDGSGEALFVAGLFQGAGNTDAWNIAKWTGEDWATVGDWVAGQDYLSVADMDPFDDGAGEKLYLAERNQSEIIVWDGVAAASIGGDEIRGEASEVAAVRLGGQALFAAFDDMGLGLWDGAAWQISPPLARGVDAAGALLTANLGDGEYLYAGGLLAGPFDDRRFVARWDGVRWEPLPGLFDPGYYNQFQNPIRALAVCDAGNGPALYATGVLWNDDTVTGGIARWDGQAWHSLGAGLYHPYTRAGNTLAVYDPGDGSQLYVGGEFTSAGGDAANNIASWDGEQWAALGNGLNDTVRTLAVADVGDGAQLYAIGDFLIADYTTIVNYIAAWDGSAWHDLAGGFDRPPSGMAVLHDGGRDDLYVIGDFTTAGGLPAGGFVRWDGEHWINAGSKPPGEAISLHALETPEGSQLFAFSREPDGTLWRGRLWRWQGAVWIPLGVFTYPGEQVDMAVFNDGSGASLFVGGDFAIVDSVVSRGIARRNLCAPDDIGADINGDGVVDQMDLGLLLQAYGTCAGDDYYNPDADLTGDDCVDQQDLGLLLQAYAG